MNKKNHLLFSGLLMAVAGVLILLSEKVGIDLVKILVPFAFAIGGLSAISFSNANKHHKVAKSYHMMQGMGMIVFAIILFNLSSSLESFLLTITYFVLFFGIVELIVGFYVLSSNHKINNKIFASRIITGIISLIGGFFLFMNALSVNATTFIIAGAITCIGGISFSVLATQMK